MTLDDIVQTSAAVAATSSRLEKISNLAALLKRLDRDVFRAPDSEALVAMPLEGRKLHVHVDWASGDTISA